MGGCGGGGGGGGGGGVAACVGGGGGLAGGGAGSGGLVDGETDGCGSKDRGASCKKERDWVGTGCRGSKAGVLVGGNVRGSNGSDCWKL